MKKQKYKSQDQDITIDDKKQSLRSRKLLSADRADENAKGLAAGYQGLPYDLPVYITVHRLLGEFAERGVDSRYGSQKAVRGLKGWVIEIDAFTYGRTIYVKLLREGGMKIFLNKRKVYEGEVKDDDDRRE